jgi:hypothetical protein
MRHRITSLGIVVAVAFVAQTVFGQTPAERTAPADQKKVEPAKEKAPMSLQRTETRTETTKVTKAEAYREVSDFFNIREANSSVRACEWEFEVEAAWMTYHRSAHHDDDFTLEPALKYGITDDLFVELSVLPINLGDGLDIQGHHDAEDGTGDLAFQVFWQFLHEDGGWMPAMATWAEMRIPTGEGSEGVDGTLHLNITKSINPCFRAHLEGFIETANGSRGDADRFENRRHFQWGIGPGVDYSLDECNTLVFNYLNRASDEYGVRNSNIFEAGYIHKLTEHQVIKAAVDAEVHEDADGPHWTAKVQWGLSW